MVEKKKVTLNKDQTISLYRTKEKEIQGISAKLKEIDNLMMEISKADHTLKELQTAKDKENLLVNVGAGILIECNIVNNKTAKITLPGNIIIDKDIKIVQADIEKRKKELIELKSKFSKSYNENMRLMQQITNAIQQMQKANVKAADASTVN